MTSESGLHLELALSSPLLSCSEKVPAAQDQANKKAPHFKTCLFTGAGLRAEGGAQGLIRVYFPCWL